jgi:hypothetical protein
MTAHHPLVLEDMLVHIPGAEKTPEKTPAHFPASIYFLPDQFTAPETYTFQVRKILRHIFRHRFSSCLVNLQHRKSRKSTIFTDFLHIFI